MGHQKGFGRSSKQQAHIKQMVQNRVAEDHDKENCPPPSKSSTSHSRRTKDSILQQRVQVAEESAAHQKRRNHNVTRQLQRAQTVKTCMQTCVDSLEGQLAISRAVSQPNSSHSAQPLSSNSKVAEAPLLQIQSLHKQVDALRKSKSRAMTTRLKAVDRAVVKEQREKLKYQLKEKGVISDASREMVRDLVGLGVPYEKVSATITTVMAAAGISVEGSVSARSVSRIIREAVVLSHMQIGHELHKINAFTISGDGTTHKKLNYESQHLYYRLSPSDSTPVSRTLGVHSSINHTSETQLDGWKDSFTDIYETYNEWKTAVGAKSSLTLADLLAKFKGMLSDHAADQKKLFALLVNLKKLVDLEQRGQEALFDMAPSKLIAILCRVMSDTVQQAGGPAAWEALPADEKTRRHVEIEREVCITYGQDAFNTLSEDEKHITGLCIWAGCCMHKDLNAVKGGDKMMRAFWTKEGLEPPLLLLNRDNRAAMSSGDSATKTRIEAVSERGAVKTTSLAGTIFRHKDDKKGQQDNFRVFFEQTFGFIVTFPDTSNTRYGSHLLAALVLLTHLIFFIQFLEIVRDSKEKVGFNNLENNLYMALHDVSTLTELAVLVLYFLSVSAPYVAFVRGKDGQEHSLNALDLGPFHAKVIAHCEAIIINPDLLLAPNASAVRGTLDGKDWVRPEGWYAVQQLLPFLPHLRGALVAFFQGAVETWRNFSSEFAEDGHITSATAEQRQQADMPATNCRNEGQLGRWCVSARHAPNKSVWSHNGQTMYKVNGVQNFARQFTVPADRAYARRRVRTLEGSGKEKKAWMIHAAHANAKVIQKRQKAADLKARRVAREEKEKAFKATLNSNFNWMSRDCPIPRIKQELAYHRARDKLVPKVSLMKKKADMVAELKAAIDRHIPDGVEADSMQPVNSNTFIEADGLPEELGAMGEDLWMTSEKDEELEEEDDCLYH
ncbi:hypothetical protein EW146_g10032 [Bondarzewia mesenterica]|uniref:Uncharacterized protein n=1 Tax=Bondarzewia mesenterica TaxID=1095465 RepID=A0A4S4L0Z5_9AGAM|nr:hypothetical protein EW146_g10032 [Bondarzewia mesenterica]